MVKKLIRKKTIVMAIPIVITLIAIPSVMYGAYTVHDPKNYAQIIKQIKETVEQIQQLKKLVDLQERNLKKLDDSIINISKVEIMDLDSAYKKLKKSTNSVISGTKDAEESFNEVFESFNKLDPDNVSYADIKGKVGNNRQKQEESTFQITKLINEKQKELEASQKRILDLSDQIKKAEGSKDLAQLDNLLQAETINSQNITNEITALKAKQTALLNQQKKLEDDANQLMNEKTANDFEKAAKVAKDAAKKTSKLTTITSEYSKLAKELGWR